MGEGLAFGLAALQAQLASVETRYELVRAGSGQRFFRVFREIFADIRAKAAQLATDASSSEPHEEPSIERNVSRLLVDLREHDALVAEYASDVGRDDLPVGYMMLVDKACLDVLGPSSDHLLHVSDKWDYSTSVVSGGLIVHVPAVDSANAFWSPILVHEAAHHAFGRVVDSYNISRASRLTDLQEVSDAHPVANARDEQLRDNLLPLWMEELYCDAFASMVVGPSFLLALSSRLVGAAWALELGHPPAELRVAVCLEILERTGWLAILDHLAVDVGTWAKDVATRQPATKDENVQFLFRSAQLLTDLVLDLAQTGVGAPLLPEPSARRANDAARYFRHSVLPVEMSHSDHIEWEFVLGAWLVALERKGFAVDAIPTVPFDRQLNGLLTKTIELSRVSYLWGESDATG